MTIRTNATGSAFSQTERRIQAQFGLFENVLYEIVDDAMRHGAEQMKDIIETEGVHNTVPNAEGRIGEGTMRDAIQHRTVKNGRGRITGQAGWLPGAPREAYFAYQEDGTMGLGRPQGDPRPAGAGNRGIRPMLAIKRANEEITVEIEEQMLRFKR